MAAAPGLSSTHSSSVRMPAPVQPPTSMHPPARAAARSAGSGLAAYSGVRNSNMALARSSPAFASACLTAFSACSGRARWPWLNPEASGFNVITPPPKVGSRISLSLRWPLFRGSCHYFSPVLAQIIDDAFGATRFACRTGVAPMQDQPVMRIVAVYLGDRLEQIFLHHEHVFPRRQPGTIGHTEDMRIHGDGRLTEGGIENHVGGFASHARQRLQFLARRRYLAAVFFEKDFAGLQDIGGLGVVEADGFDVALETPQSETLDPPRRARHLEEFRGGLVDAFVRGLGGEDHRHQQFKGRVIFKFRRRAGIGAFQSPEDFCSLGGRHKE